MEFNRSLYTKKEVSNFVTFMTLELDFFGTDIGLKMMQPFFREGC
jgi:hypothetical protein